MATLLASSGRTLLPARLLVKRWMSGGSRLIGGVDELQWSARQIGTQHTMFPGNFVAKTFSASGWVDEELEDGNHARGKELTFSSADCELLPAAAQALELPLRIGTQSELPML